MPDERSGLEIPAGDPVTAWRLALDPSEVADPDRVELDINSSTITISQDGIDWGDAAIQEYLADQVVGSTLVDFRLPNRTVTMSLSVGDGDETTYLAAKAALQQKVALIQREGGWLKRDTGIPLYADIVNATLTFPDHWGAVGFIEDGVKLVLECVPDFYGDEITLDTISCTGDCVAVLEKDGEQAVIEGDHPGRVRIAVTDTSGESQQSVLWGFRSRYYTTDEIASEGHLIAVAGLPTPTLAGSWDGTVVQISTSDFLNTSAFQAMALLGGGHIGTFRVWARCYATGGEPQLRFQWQPGAPAGPVTNDLVAMPGAGAFYMLDLGPLALQRTPVGDQAWWGQIQALATGAGQSIAIDRVWLQPLDEASGSIKGTGTAAPASVSFPDDAVFANGTTEARTDGVWRAGTIPNYVPATTVLGDLPRIPPSGLEARAVQLLVRPSRGDLAAVADSGIDTFTVQVVYRPSHLFPA